MKLLPAKAENFHYIHQFLASSRFYIFCIMNAAYTNNKFQRNTVQ